MANLTSRELGALEDVLDAELLLVKKYKSYAALSTDPQLRTQYEQLAGKHQNHFDRLMGFLN
ncbi:MAG: spore coat protein [Clostridiales bacterium]|nr:spore coat protein [Clostridiales bacterium]